MEATELDPDLLALLEEHVPVGSIIPTISSGAPNRVVAVSRAGIDVETERSQSRASGPRRVPAWMIQIAWQRLQSRGRLTNRELLASDDLNVKRSSFVCAVLAKLPGVEVQSTRPLVLILIEGS